MENGSTVGSLKVTLSPREVLTLPGNGGEALHGLFLALLARRSPELASQVHDMPGPKPFSLSPLQGCQHWEGHSLLAMASQGFFQVGLLETDLLAVATAALFEAKLNQEELSLRKAPVKITGVAAEGTRIPSFALYRDILAQARENREIALGFLSPTAFKVKGKNFLFPLPELVFSSLARHWNAFSGIPLPLSLEESFASIAVSRYELRTEIIAFSHYKWIGFTGWATFLLPAGLPAESVRAINCLADFAFYAGVGAKTTMGMGQTRRIDYARPLPHRAGGYRQETGGPAAGHQG